jgi:hypothetical protein
MIWQLAKRDPAWQMGLILVPVGAVACAVMPREFLGMFAFLVATSWFANLPHERATLFQAALPIRARDLFLARILALFAGVWLPVASGVALVLLVGKPAEDAATLVEIGAAFSVLVLMAQSSRVREIAGSMWALCVLMAIAWGAGVLIWMLVPRAVVLAVCAVVCPLLFWNIWRQLPTTFEVLPAKLERQASRVGDAAEPAFVWWPILRALFPPRILLFLPMLVFMPHSGLWMFVSIFCFMPVMTAVGNIPWTLGLPVRRGALLAAALLPWLTLLLLGLLISNWSAPKPPLRMGPPLEFWRMGNAPVIVAPWGESWQPATVHLGGVAIYNPYGYDGRTSSPRFFEWQFRRTTQAVYGVAMDYRDYALHGPRVHPLMRQPRLAILSLAACACWVLLLFNVVFTAWHWRLCRVWYHGRAVAGWMLASPIVCVLGLDLAPGNRGFQGIGMSLVNAGLLRISAWLPAGLPAVVLAAVLPVALLWWTAARLFRGVEIPRATVAAARA